MYFFAQNSKLLTSYLLPLIYGRAPPGRAFGTNSASSVNVPLSLTHNAPPNPMQIRNAAFRYGATLKNKTARELTNYITVVPASFPVSFLNMERNQPTRKKVCRIIFARPFFIFSFRSLRCISPFRIYIRLSKREGTAEKIIMIPPTPRLVGGIQCRIIIIFIVVLYHFSMKNDSA